MSPQKNTCKNCDKQFDPSYQFCPYCGQKSNDQLTMKVLFHNTISNYFSVDARFLKSFVPLLFKPGFLPKEFVKGKRLIYLHPAQTYLFISVVFFFLFSFVAREQQRAVDKVLSMGFDDNNIEQTEPIDSAKKENVFISYDSKEISENNLDTITAAQEKTIPKTEEKTNGVNVDYKQNKVDSLIAVGAPKIEILKSLGMTDDPSALEQKFFEQVLKFHKRSGKGILRTFYDTLPIAMFFLLPVFAFLLKLFYFKKGRFAHHMVFSFYFFSFLFVIFSILLLNNFIWNVPGWLTSLVLLSTFFYLLVGTKRFYGENYFLGFIKSSLVTFLFFIFVVPFASMIMVLVAFMFY